MGFHFFAAVALTTLEPVFYSIHFYIKRAMSKFHVSVADLHICRQAIEILPPLLIFITIYLC